MIEDNSKGGPDANDFDGKLFSEEELTDDKEQNPPKEEEIGTKQSEIPNSIKALNLISSETIRKLIDWKETNAIIEACMELIEPKKDGYGGKHVPETTEVNNAHQTIRTEIPKAIEIGNGLLISLQIEIQKKEEKLKPEEINDNKNYTNYPSRDMIDKYKKAKSNISTGFRQTTKEISYLENNLKFIQTKLNRLNELKEKYLIF